MANDTGQPMSLGRKAALGAAIVLGAAAIAFVVQNSDSVEVQWLGFTVEAPLFLVMLLSGFMALGVRDLIGWALRRQEQRRERRTPDERT